MKILHTADWHLGKSFNNYNLLEDQRLVLQGFVDIIDHNKPDVILLAGDIYDRSVPPADAISLFDEVMSQIILDRGIPVIAIAGNHDNPDRINYCNYLLKRQGLHIFGSLAIPLPSVVLEDEYGPIHFYPIPYTEPEVLRYLLKDENMRSHAKVMDTLTHLIEEQHPAGQRKVLIGHAFLAGGVESESERQLLVGGAAQISPHTFKDFDYTAMGHLHQPQAFLNEKVQYAGSLLKYSFSEVHHRKAVVLIDMDASGAVKTQRIPLKAHRDVRKIKGTIQDRKFVADGEKDEANAEDFVEVSLLNDDIVPNAMQIVQESYPHAMALKWPELNRSLNQRQLTSESLHKMNETELFNTFYERFIGKPMNEPKEEIVDKTLKKIRKLEE